IIRYFNINFTVLNRRELNISYGLLTLHNRMFKVKKLQQLSISNNWFLRKRNLSFVTLLQSENAVGKKQTSSTILPGLDKVGLAHLESLFFGKEIIKGHALRPTQKKLIFNFTLKLLFFSILTLLAST